MQQAEPLAPSSQWRIDYQPAGCALSRHFGIGNGLAVVTVRPTTVFGPVDLVINSSAQWARGDRIQGRARVIPASGAPIAALYSNFERIAGMDRTVDIHLSRADVPALATAGTIAVELNGKHALSIAPTGAAAAIKALEACERDLAKTWGFDAERLAAVTVPAQPTGAPIDFRLEPSDPDLRAAAVNKTVMVALLEVGVDGRITDCRMAVSAKIPRLEARACRLIVARARYAPARGPDGSPVASQAALPVEWGIPITRISTTP